LAPAKKGHATKKRAIQALPPPVQKSKRFKPTEPDMMTKKTSSKKIVPKHMSQVEEPYDSDESSVSASKPAGADKTTNKTASKKGFPNKQFNWKNHLTLKNRLAPKNP
jgi:hypothetical protein